MTAGRTPWLGDQECFAEELMTGRVRGEGGQQCIQVEELKKLSDGRVRLLRGGTAAREGFEGTGETRGGHNGAKGPT